MENIILVLSIYGEACLKGVWAYFGGAFAPSLLTKAGSLLDFKHSAETVLNLRKNS